MTESIRDDRVALVRKLIYAYIIMLVFEGALRKWVFYYMPTVSAALLIVRDPIAIAMIVYSWYIGLLRGSTLIAIWLIVSIILVGLATLQLAEDPKLGFLVVIYGLRTYILHIPVIVIIARTIRYHDLQRLGQWALIAALPMALLMMAQFAAPEDGVLNRGAGVGSTQIESVMGHIRPAGTFSYNSGAGSFNLIVGAFLLYSFINQRMTSRLIRVLSIVGLVAVLPISQSRGFVVSVAVLLTFALVGGLLNPKVLRISIQVSLTAWMIFCALTLLTVYRRGVTAFAERWSTARGMDSSTDAIVGRYFDEYIGAYDMLWRTPMIGYGLGLGSNVGAVLTVGSADFLLAESEWQRNVLEMGPIVGSIWLGTRSILALVCLYRAGLRMRAGDALGWLLIGAEGPALFNGSFAQPTSLGFIVVTTGLALAAISSGVPSAGYLAVGYPRPRQIRIRQYPSVSDQEEC